MGDDPLRFGHDDDDSRSVRDAPEVGQGPTATRIHSETVAVCGCDDLSQLLFGGRETTASGSTPSIANLSGLFLTPDTPTMVSKVERML